ncbi:MAG: HPr(Ser) kinase/phosphatase [Erysipelotrichia bacterium]|nr:HPr(Ser) kinase/phosphatase [Erysipelotrichia bacterium]
MILLLSKGVLSMDMEQYTKRVMVREIADFFKFERVTGNDESLNRWVVVPDVNRPGFELAGYFMPTDPRRVVIIGNKEESFIKSLSEDEQRGRYPYITDGLTPCIIITHNNPVPWVLQEIAAQQNFPIFRTPLDTYRVMADLITFLDEKLAPEDTISGVLMAVYGRGILITGESGLGKSEAALELIRDGQVLIADDRVDVQKVHNTIFGHAPELLKGMLELRGVGIIDVERMYGANFLSDTHQVDMVITLVHFDRDMEYDRTGDSVEHFTKILDVLIPTLILPVSPGRSMGAIIESAVSNYILKEEGYDSAKVFKERLHNFLLKENAKQKEGNNK